MLRRLWLLGIAALVWGCSLISSQPADQDQHLFLGEFGRQTHGRMTWFDHLVEFDPGTFYVRTAADYRAKPPQKIAVLPFTDTGSGNYVLNGAPVAVRKSDELADWRWTDSNRLRKVFEGYLAEREFATVNLADVDAILAAHGINDDAKLSHVTPQQLGRWLGVDAVVYGEVKHYEVYYFYLVAGWRVKLKVKMVSTKNGCALLAAAGTRFKMEVKPAVALRDIAFNSAIELTDLRDVDLRRAEEEAAREIVWRIPYATHTDAPPSPPEASGIVSRSAESASMLPETPAPGQQFESNRNDPTKASASNQTPEFAKDWTPSLAVSTDPPLPADPKAGSPAGEARQLDSLRTRRRSGDGQASGAMIVAQDASDGAGEWRALHSSTAPLDKLDPPATYARRASLDLDSTSREDLAGREEPVGALQSDPLDLPAQTVETTSTSACIGEAMWNNEDSYSEAASHPERFFLPEQRNLRHGRKTVLDRMIETDPETFPMHVAQRYYENPPSTVAVLPFRYTGSGNLQVDKLVPVTFHGAREQEKWRWTVGNRVRRTFTAYLAQREFEIVPLPKVDAALKTLGITTYQQLMQITPAQLGRWLHVDAVVYGDVTRYEGYYAFLVGGWIVGLRVRMVSTANGQELINAEGGRWAMVLQPALTLTDILIDSGLNLFESLRDIRITRAEEETCREITLRIPEVARSPHSLHVIDGNRHARGQKLAPTLVAGNKPGDNGHDSSIDEFHDAPAAN